MQKQNYGWVGGGGGTRRDSSPLFTLKDERGGLRRRDGVVRVAAVGWLHGGRGGSALERVSDPAG